MGSPRRNATITDLQRAKDARELRSETEPELLNDAIFGAIYYRMLLRSGPLTKRFGEDLVDQVIRGHLGKRPQLTEPRDTMQSEGKQTWKPHRRGSRSSPGE